MNKNIRQISQNIQNNRLPEENIPQLFNYMADHYTVLAEVRLAMHYFTFYEAYYDEEGTWSADACGMVDRINLMIKDNILHFKNGDSREAAIKDIDSVRQEITRRMSALTAYTDIFQNCEYILNRLEYRFKNIEASVDDIEFSKEILRYIFDSEDNLMINEKIKDIIGQLPVRMTKQRYFEIIKESLGAYLGSEAAAFDSFLYMLKTSAMLKPEEGMEALYPGLWEKKEFLLRTDYKNISREIYEKALGMLKAAVLILETETSIYFSLQEIVNELYTITLCIPYSGMTDSGADKAKSAAITVIGGINDIFGRREKCDIPDRLIEALTGLEGVQEELSLTLQFLENAFYEVGKNHKALTASLVLEQPFLVLGWSQKLLSNSLFIDFIKEPEEAAIVDEDRIELETQVMLQELTAFFLKHDKMISRAVMANTINKVPVFFQNHREIMDYVIYSLTRCSDPYEKATCIEIIRQIMQA